MQLGEKMLKGLQSKAAIPQEPSWENQKTSWQPYDHFEAGLLFFLGVGG